MRLASVPNWRAEERELVRDVRLSDYSATVAFVNEIARIATEMDHHPVVTFGYRTCTIRYTTHSAGGLTDLDFTAASRIDAISA